jgi:hypothetical protein
MRPSQQTTPNIHAHANAGFNYKLVFLIEPVRGFLQSPKPDLAETGAVRTKRRGSDRVLSTAATKTRPPKPNMRTNKSVSYNFELKRVIKSRPTT